MSLKSIDSEIFLTFGLPINDTDDLNFLKNYNYEEKCCEKKEITFITSSRLYMENLGGQAVLNCALMGNSQRFTPFLFDSPLILNPGVCFSITPITDDFVYCLYYENELELLHKPNNYILSTCHQVRCNKLILLANKRFPNGLVFRPETQPFWELTFFRKGKLTTTVDNNTYKLKGNYCRFIPPNAPHSLKSAESEVEYLVAMFEMECPEHEVTSEPIEVTPKIKYYIDRISEVMEESSSYTDDYVLSLLSLIVMEFIKIKSKEDERRKLSVNSSAQMDATIDGAERIIDENIFNPELSVKFIAENLFVSTSYLYKCSMRRYGIGVLNYIHNRKLEVAKNLIANGNYSLSEIAANLNFCSQSYFSTQFKKEYGISPLQYRRNPDMEV